MKILVTSGGTKVPIDSVRDITNMSAGTFGSKIAKQFMVVDHQVCFFHAKGSKTPFKFELNLADHTVFEAMREFDDFTDEIRQYYGKYSGKYSEQTFRNFDDYADGLFDMLRKDKYDIVVLAAAVSDYGVVTPVDGKVRSNDNLQIDLTPLPKLISKIKSICPKICLVGFKLLVGSQPGELQEAVKKSIETNDCDLVIGNDLSDLKSGNHTLHLGFKRTGEIEVHKGNNLADVVVQSAIQERVHQNEIC